ncbi:hypothetical protein [Lyngbya aestuarii]|uniref:hypothetical protein n=1 Tax=Lyngbya aestuarii TaxID=118322 RepID=UPI00403DF2AC
MKYTFEILGVSPVIDFFSYQLETKSAGPEYLGTYQCTLDAFIESVETVPPKRGWELDKVVDTVIKFWVNHSERIRYWQTELNDTGENNLLVSRVADVKSLKAEFESLLGQNS